MPGSSRRVRPMSDELPPAGALRLARVAGVPVYLDRTWLLLGAFVAWTGWQAGQRPRHRASLASTRSGASSASSSPCSATRSPTPSRPGCSGSGCTASSRPCGVGTPPTTARVDPGPHRGRRRGRPRREPRARRAWAARRPRCCRGRHSEFARSFTWLNLLLAGFNLLPGLPLDGGQLVQSLVWEVTGRRDLGLVVAGWCGRLLAVAVLLWYVARPLAEGDTDLFGMGLAAGHGLDPLVRRHGRAPARPAGTAAAAGTPRGRHGPRGGGPRPDPGR